MIFEQLWQTGVEGTVVTVSDGLPPPSTNTEGMPYKAWKSNNFTGTLELKHTVNGWDYIRFQLDQELEGDQVEYLAYDVPRGGPHTFSVEEDI